MEYGIYLGLRRKCFRCECTEKFWEVGFWIRFGFGFRT